MGESGPYLLILGGCANPNEPYPYLCQLSLSSYSVAYHASLSPVVAHESSIFKDELYVVGGSDGVGPVDTLTIVGEKVRSEKGLTGLGATSFVTDRGLVVYGGINPQSSSFNGWALL